MIRLSTRLCPLLKRGYATRYPHPVRRKRENANPLSDFLQELQPRQPSAPGRSKPLNNKERRKKTAAPRLQKEVIKGEKKAILDIYNYAASQGLIPEIEMHMGRTGSKRKGSAIATVTIKLQEQGIVASATLPDHLEAEVTAALDFKRQAEEYQVKNAGNITPLPGFELLNTQTVDEFISWLKHYKKNVRYRVVSEVISQGRKNQAWVTANDEPVVPEDHKVVARNPKETEKLAWLVAAIHLCREDPSLLTKFQESLKKGAGSYMPKPSPLPEDHCFVYMK